MKKISVLIQSKSDFDKLKVLTDSYLDWNESYLSRPTSIVLKDKKKSDFGVGSVGCMKSQKANGFTIIDINFKII